MSSEDDVGLPRRGAVQARSPSAAARRRPGRPRPPATDQAIIEATIELLAQRGAAATTIEAVAQRSGSAKTTIYRRWASREALILDALRVAVRGSNAQVDDTQTLDRALGSTIRGSARTVLDLVRNPVFRAAFPTIAHEMLTETGVGARFRGEVFRPIRVRMRRRLQAEIDRGTVRGDIDHDLIFDLVNGAVLYRALLGEPLDDETADRIADLALLGAAPRRAADP